MRTKTSQSGQLRVLAPAIAAFAFSFAFTGCSALSLHDAASAPAGSLSIVHSVRANQPIRDLGSSPEIRQVIDQHLGGVIPIVTSEGLPRLITNYDSTPTALNSTTEVGEREKFTTEIMNAMYNEAQSPESDPLRAISLAANAIANRPGERTILVVDSGLATSGAMAFQNSRLLHRNVDLTAVVDELEAAHALPENLGGVRVIWIGLGQTQAPQESLDEATSQRLKAVWLETLSRAGAQLEFIDAPLSTLDGNPPKLPSVSPLDVEQFTLTPPKVALNLEDATLNFAPDSAEVTLG